MLAWFKRAVLGIPTYQEEPGWIKPGDMGLLGARNGLRFRSAKDPNTVYCLISSRWYDIDGLGEMSFQALANVDALGVCVEVTIAKSVPLYNGTAVFIKLRDLRIKSDAA